MPTSPEMNDQPTLETQVITLLAEVREKLDQGSELGGFTENPHKAALQEAVGGLSVAALTGLLAGKSPGEEPVASAEGVDTLQGVASLWSANQQARQLRSFAYAQYSELKREELDALLEGKRITATTRQNPGGLCSAISRSNGAFETSGDSPGTVSGTFYGSEPGLGSIILLADDPDPRTRYWRISLISALNGEQEADFTIEDPAN